jgi:hypothetical protein
MDWQGIHIGTKPDGLATITGATQNTDNAGLAHAPMHLNAKTFQLFGDKVRGPDFFVIKLGVLVQKVPPGTHFILLVSN